MSLENLPKLGFGLMRLPEKDGQIDMAQVCEMVDTYMASGANYFDTAYVYHGGLTWTRFLVPAVNTAAMVVPQAFVSRICSVH